MEAIKIPVVCNEFFLFEGWEDPFGGVSTEEALSKIGIPVFGCPGGYEGGRLLLPPEILVKFFGPLEEVTEDFPYVWWASLPFLGNPEASHFYVFLSPEQKREGRPLFATSNPVELGDMKRVSEGPLAEWLLTPWVDHIEWAMEFNEKRDSWGRHYVFKPFNYRFPIEQTQFRVREVPNFSKAT